jgi:hypothetical protein
MVRKSGKLVYGVGINDVDEPTAKFEKQADGKYKQVEYSVPYNVWTGVLQRCYKGGVRFYEDVTVCEEWFKYSNFKQWCESQGDIVGLSLDKDLINPSARMYSPETCLFIPAWLNLQLIERGKRRGKYPLGVCKYKDGFISNIGDGSGITKKYLGYYKTPEEAHRAWQIAKVEKLKDCIIRLRLEYKGDRLCDIEYGIQRRINLLEKHISENSITLSINSF